MGGFTHRLIPVPRPLAHAACVAPVLTCAWSPSAVLPTGPALVGLGLRLFVKAKGPESYTAELMVPAVLLFIIVTINLIAIVFSDIDEAYFEDEAAIVAVLDERTPLAAKASRQQQQPPPSEVAAEVGKPGGSSAAATIDVAAPATSRAKPYWVAAAVQITCATYTFTRVFLRYSYESAMVVVYSDTYKFSDGDAGMIAGGAAFSALLAVILWRQVQKRYAANLKEASHMVMFVSEICGFLCAIVMIISPSIRLAAGRDWGLVFTLLTAVFFYPSQVPLAAAPRACVCGTSWMPACDPPSTHPTPPIAPLAGPRRFHSQFVPSGFCHPREHVAQPAVDACTAGACDAHWQRPRDVDGARDGGHGHEPLLAAPRRVLPGCDDRAGGRRRYGLGPRAHGTVVESLPRPT